MRRRASILALTVAALASVATKTGDPAADFTLRSDAITVDPAAPGPYVVAFDAAWSEEARRRAAIVGGDFRVWVDVSDPVPENLVVRVDGDLQRAVVEQDLLADSWEVCDEADACSIRAQVDFVVPEGADPVQVVIEATATVYIQDEVDRPDLDGEITLSGPGVP